VRWRQLVELVARGGSDADRDLVGRANEIIRADSPSIDERVKTAAALAIAPLALPLELVATFAADRLSVAAPVLASARLTASEWTRVSSSASDECRGFIASMRAEGGPQQAAQQAAVPSIGDVVARIERLRQSREVDATTAPIPGKRAPAEDSPRLFRWECNETGEIEWVEGAPRGALVGQSIAQVGLDGGVDKAVERAFAARAPFHEGTLELKRGGVTAGTWKISGVPAFEPASGRFAGYRGLAERAGAKTSRTDEAGIADVDSLRELAHEIKTPLNAIIGFAEIISGEHLGPAETRYRERASEIVAQAQLLLAAVEDIDFAAKLASSDGGAVSDLADALAGSWDQIERVAEERGALLEIEGAEDPARCALSPQLSQRLVERFCFAAIGAAGDGETLAFRLGSDERCCAISVNRPASLAAVDLRPDRNRRASDVATLPLRLVMGLARTAGGELETSGDRLTLRLPKA
jgi:signal transduction histidine kinase